MVSALILSGNQAFMARVYLSWLPQVPLLSTDLCIFGFLSSSAMSTFKSTVIVSHCFIWDQKNTGALDVKLQLELELYFYLNTVNLSDKIIIKIITIYFNLYKHDLKI